MQRQAAGMDGKPAAGVEKAKKFLNALAVQNQWSHEKPFGNSLR